RENPRSATRLISACFWLGPDQRITSGPAARAAASKAEYMAAPEHFAEISHSPCNAGAVHTWHFSDLANESSVGLLCGVKMLWGGRRGPCIHRRLGDEQMEPPDAEVDTA